MLCVCFAGVLSAGAVAPGSRPGPSCSSRSYLPSLGGCQEHPASGGVPMVVPWCSAPARSLRL